MPHRIESLLIADTAADLLQRLQAAHAAAGRPSHRQLERETSVSNSVISRALTGERIPSRPALLALAEALGADPDVWGRLWDANDAARARSREQVAVLAALAVPDYSRKHGATCSVDGCDRPYSARGLCRPHYQRHLRMAARAAAQSD